MKEVLNPGTEKLSVSHHLIRTPFHLLWGLRDTCNAEKSVVVYNPSDGEKTIKLIFREYKTFLWSPRYRETLNKSYMFSGTKQEKDIYTPLPGLLKPTHRDACDRFGVNFDNCVVNWYEPEDYIEPHTDCTFNLDQTSPVVVYNFQPLNDTRSFQVTWRGGKNENLNIKLENGMVICLPAEVQKETRHSVGKGDHRRISVTFRKLKDKEEEHQ